MILESSVGFFELLAVEIIFCPSLKLEVDLSHVTSLFLPECHFLEIRK